ncbi:nucleoid-associated protein [Methylobacterium sp.]|uniref:nucleoid-associated protein n=1 Tax=Methylobacterium sp. TaxID=409 RepID=UPI0025809E5F|nr:nucleoid-associated protein [Methylobacterium sp.]
MTNTIIRVAIHDLSRTAKGFVVKHGKDDLQVSPTIQRVIDDLTTLYGRRTSKSYGKFSADEDHFPTEKHLRAYIGVQPNDFTELTHKMMETLKAQAGYRSAATGGHVFFAHFEREDRHYLLIAIVNEKLGASMTSDLDVRDVRHLDMDGFRFAGRINMTGWSAGEERYIGFLKGKREVSEYFKEFLGCDTTVQNRRDTTELVDALMAFATNEGMDTPSKDDFLARAKLICERSARAQEELSFEALANELSPHDPERLMTALADPELRLNDGFVPDRRALGPLVKFKGKTPTWSIEFNRDAITRGNIRFNPEDNTLTLTGLPEDLSAQLRSEYSQDG